MKITIKDIANEAGVSIATVSKILNKKDDNISEKTRQKVLAIIKEKNYIPNTIARSLVTKQTKTIGLVIPDITNPFFPELVRGAEDCASACGYNIFFCNTDDKIEKEEKYINMLVEKMVDGIIFTQSANNNEGFNHLSQIKKPMVLIDRDVDIPNIKGKVLVDNFNGACEGVKYLIKSGYKKIAFISGPFSTKTSLDRLEGYKKALEENNLLFDKELVLEGEYKEEWGNKAIGILIRNKILFDAIFCANDIIALSAMKSLKEAGMRIPQDVAVLGYDDIYMAKLTDPALTTIRQPNYEMGYEAVKLLVEILENEKVENTLIRLNTELVIRQST
ncbi:LacI family DNA-binding transcriptional regulator [Crassaminicella indica]|uniref:LacI family transcriptional regulator n=1 Tax=Crassaminicella indica TaxID=2855394 RepID=A0ABX8RBU8_9CLOT|nr:LacI family DNA-binding transcriptional regulator [Crassaminicella indica]QXM06286.1 LacI family transcriptional regulator [Crassaminicella indica]